MVTSNTNASSTFENNLERGPGGGLRPERSEQDIAESNAIFNQGLYSFDKGVDGEDIVNAMAIGTRTELQGSDNADMARQEVMSVFQDLENPYTVTGEQFAQSVEWVETGANETLQRAGLENTEDANIKERTAAAVIEGRMNGEVTSGAGILDHTRQENVIKSTLAERVIGNAMGGDVDTIAYVEELARQNGDLHSHIHTIKEMGGVEKVNNERLEEVGRMIQSSNVSLESVKATQEETPDVAAVEAEAPLFDQEVDGSSVATGYMGSNERPVGTPTELLRPSTPTSERQDALAHQDAYDPAA